MSGSSSKRWLAIVGLVAVLTVGIVTQAAIAIADLWEGLTTVAETTPVASTEAPAVPRRPASARRGAPGVVARPEPVEAARPLPAAAPLVRGGMPTAPSVTPVETTTEDERREQLEARRAARERWRESQSPEELEARRLRQRARRGEMTPEEQALRDEQRAARRQLVDDAAEDDPEAP